MDAKRKEKQKQRKRDSEIEKEREKQQGLIEMLALDKEFAEETCEELKERVTNLERKFKVAQSQVEMYEKDNTNLRQEVCVYACMRVCVCVCVRVVYVCV